MTRRQQVTIKVPREFLMKGAFALALQSLVNETIAHDDLATLGYCDVDQAVIESGHCVVVKLRLSARHPDGRQPERAPLWERRVVLSAGLEVAVERLLALVNAPSRVPLFSTVELTEQEWIVLLETSPGARKGTPGQPYPSR